MKRIITSLMLSVLMTWPVMSADQTSSVELPTKYKPVKENLVELLQSSWRIEKMTSIKNKTFFLLNIGENDGDGLYILCELDTNKTMDQINKLPKILNKFGKQFQAGKSSLPATSKCFYIS